MLRNKAMMQDIQSNLWMPDYETTVLEIKVLAIPVCGHAVC